MGDESLGEFMAWMPDPPEPQPRGNCENPYCLDGYVDREVGTQDGRESWVEQVPCGICNDAEREAES